MPRHSIVIRDVTDADAAAVAALLTELGHPTEASKVPERLAQMHREGGAALLAVDADAQALGYISLASYAAVQAKGPIGLITALVITAGARGQGVGRQLVQAAIAWATARGCVRLNVTSGEARADAHAFYPACGLVYTGRRFTIPISSA